MAYPHGASYEERCCFDSASLLHRQERDDLDAVLGAGVARLVGDELVPVLADLLDAQTRRLDRLAVGIVLGGAADAGGPEIGIADDALGQLLAADDVGDRHPTPGSQDAGGLTE